MGDKFEVTLASNFKSNARNKPADCETALARPLDLPGELEVALIDLTYPHKWINLDKAIYIPILTDFTQNISEMLLDNLEIRESQCLYCSIISPQGLARMWVRRMARISPGNFTAQPISDFILLMLKDFVKDIEQPEIDFLKSTQRVRFWQKRIYAIATLTDNSVLHILGLDKQSTRINEPEKPGVEYIIFDASETVLSEQAP